MNNNNQIPPTVNDEPTVGKRKEEDHRDKNKLIQFSLFQTHDGSPLSKSYCLENDELVKEPGGIMTEGTGKVILVGNLIEFAEVVDGLGSDQALAFGVPRQGQQEWKSCTQDAWEKRAREPKYLPRTQENFRFPDGGGILQMDYDPDGQPKEYTPGSLVETLEIIFPAFKDVAWVSKPSNSSGLAQAETGEVLTEDSGFRLYFEVENASLIPPVMKRIETALWAFDMGWVKISKAGSQLLRCPIDMAVYQSNRLDFAGPPKCEHPVVKQSGKCVYHDGGVLRLSDIKEPMPKLMTTAKRKRAEMQESSKQQAREVRAQYIRSKAKEMVGENGSYGELEETERTVRRAVEGSSLGPDFIISIQMDGRIQEVPVSDVLKNADNYNGAQCLDPLEPEYHGNALVAKIFLSSGRPVIHSFAHGGRVFTLHSEVRRLELRQGRTADYATELVELMAQHGCFYTSGDCLSVVAGEKIHPLNEHSLALELSRFIQSYRVNRSNNQAVDIDPPDPALKMILRGLAHIRTEFPQLKGVVDHPVISPEGVLVEAPGYDPSLCMYLTDSVGEYVVPSSPTSDQLEDALRVLWHPFKDFPFVSDTDCGVFLAALLSSICRVILPTCPAFGMDAPEQGSGKTLLALACGSLGAEVDVPVKPLTRQMSDEEFRKNIFASLLEGHHALVLDNLMGAFDSPVLAAALTSDRLNDRVLGVSQTRSVPNRALFLLTGNNMCLAGDMPRRVLITRIDAKVPDPTRRKFDLDPLAWVKGNRREMIEAGLTLVMGRFASRYVESDDSTASFEAWDRLVRQTVIWVSTWDERFADPAGAIEKARSLDPEREMLGRLLLSIYRRMKSRPFTVSELCSLLSGCYNPDLREALEDLIHDDNVTARKVGRSIKYRLDRRVYGLSLQDAGKRTGANVFRVMLENEDELSASLGDLGIDPKQFEGELAAVVND